MQEHLKKVIECIKQAQEHGALKTREDVLTGYSGKALYGTLQLLAKNVLAEDECYLEIGVFQGLTLLSSAMAAPEKTFYGIDNFAFFDPEGRNEKIVKERKEKLGLANAHLINSDYEKALENLEKYIGAKKVGLYFIDGPHDYRSQLICLLLIKPYLSNNAVILIDDSNYRHVRQANRDFLFTHPEFKLLYQSYTPAHPINMTETQKKAAIEGWWDGINIIYKDPNNELNQFFPETVEDRSLYENEHILHASKYPEHLLFVSDLLKRFNFYFLLSLLRKPRELFTGKFRSTNTYSEDLPVNDFNGSIS